MAEEDDPLDALLETEKLVIKQEVSLLEVAAQTAANALDLDALGNLGETANRYDIFTDNGGLQFKVVETSEACGCTGCCPTGRICCNPNHALQLHVFAPEHSPKDAIMFVDRPCKCGQCCSCCSICQQEMRVYRGADDGPPGGDGDAESLIAYIHQPFMGGGFSPKLEVMEREDSEDIMFNVQSQAFCCIAGICCDHTFNVTDSEGEYMGKIVKESPENLGELAKELGTDADRFTLYVKSELDKEKKAAMLASLHLIDYMFFENEGAVNADLTPLANGSCPEISFKCCDCYCCGCVCPCSCTCGGDDGDNDEDEPAEEAPEEEPVEEAEEEEPEEEEPEEEEPEEEEPEEEEPEEEEPEEE
eukprot:CAMPEP_0178929930 /NCGR_PEP_ID=MMETSP0786-20121207/20925_1 /TAXON_ID=186022 /ORGANISM="Thalassionema frauenfeldii, Strain CCMP 1798" /LENGTH=360 /DNA_ID=CAMNT_0020606345 /DNA_START=90 /DNA_END=1172 /DNA_ORIENTATION=+